MLVSLLVSTSGLNMRPLVLLLCVLGTTGCPRRVDFGSRGQITDVAELLELTRRLERKPGAVVGEARLNVDSAEARGTVSLFVAVASPAFVHFESLGFFGKPEGILVSDGKRFTLYEVEQGRLTVGPASPTNVSRFLPVALPGEELVAILLGRALNVAWERLGGQEAAPKAELSIDGELRAYRVVLSGERGEARVWIDPAVFRVVRAEVGGAPPFVLEYEDFGPPQESAFPRKVRLRSEARPAELELRYRDVELDPPFDASLFVLEAPEGVTRVEVDERGRAW